MWGLFLARSNLMLSSLLLPATWWWWLCLVDHDIYLHDHYHDHGNHNDDHHHHFEVGLSGFTICRIPLSHSVQRTGLVRAKLVIIVIIIVITIITIVIVINIIVVIIVNSITKIIVVLIIISSLSSSSSSLSQSVIQNWWKNRWGQADLVCLALRFCKQCIFGFFSGSLIFLMMLFAIGHTISS